MKNIHKTIISLRSQRGWSQVKLAKKINVSTVSIGRYERAEATPSLEVAVSLAEVFEVSIDFLLNAPVELSAFELAVLQRFKQLDLVEQPIRENLLLLVDDLIRDHIIISERVVSYNLPSLN